MQLKSENHWSFEIKDSFRASWLMQLKSDKSLQIYFFSKYLVEKIIVSAWTLESLDLDTRSSSGTPPSARSFNRAASKDIVQ